MPGRHTETAQQHHNAADAAKGVTVMLTIDSKGRKFPPWIIFSGKGENPGIRIRRQLIALEKEGWSQVRFVDILHSSNSFHFIPGFGAF
jgi:hypothetical protein